MPNSPQNSPAAEIDLRNSSARIPGAGSDALRRVTLRFTTHDRERVELKFLFDQANEPLTLELPTREVWRLAEWLDNQTISIESKPWLDAYLKEQMSPE